MPLQQIPLPYLHYEVMTKDLYPNFKLFTDNEISAIIDGLQDKPDGRYRKEIFNRVQMKMKNYGIIKHEDNYFAVYPRTIYDYEHHKVKYLKVKLAQDLRTGEWLRLKVYTNKHAAENEFNYLLRKDLAVCKISRLSRDQGQAKIHLLTRITPGVDLNEFIQRGVKHISTLHCMQLAIAILEQVKAVHDDGYLLCKLAPENILCDNTHNSVTLCDFEAITAMDAAGNAQHTFTGTDIYLAPELLDEFYFIHLIKAIHDSALSATKTRLDVADMLAILETSPILRVYKKEKKLAIIDKLRRLSKDDFERLEAKACLRDLHDVVYTYSRKTESYSVGVILKILLNIPVEDPTKADFFKVGKEKSFSHHGQIVKWLDAMTAADAGMRLSVEDTLVFFKDYHQRLLQNMPFRVGIIDVYDFNLAMKNSVAPTGFWDNIFTNVIQQMDEIYIVSKQPHYPEYVRIQKALTRMGAVYNKDIHIVRTVEDLAQVPVHINEQANDAVIRSFTYFDFSLYSRPENSYYTQRVKENGISLSSPNGHHHANHDDLSIVLTPPAAPPMQLLQPQNVNDFLLENGINVISIDVKKSLSVYTQQLSQCLVNVTPEQYQALKVQLESEIHKLDTRTQTQSGLSTDSEYLPRMRAALAFLVSIHDKQTLTYAITQATLDNLQKSYKRPESAIARLFARRPVSLALQDELKLPEKSVLRLAN